MAKAIELTQGYSAIVDDRDYEALSQHKWRAMVVRLGHKKRVYAVRGKRSGKKKKTILMHREILRAGPDQSVDHIDGDGCNNRRCNIRACTKSQNQYNRRKNGGKTTSIYKGVRYCARHNRWRAAAGGKHIGSFSSEAEAAIAYDNYVQKHWGDYALKNFAESVDSNAIQLG